LAVDAFTYLLGITWIKYETYFQKLARRPDAPWFTKRNDSVMINTFIMLVV